MALPKVTHLQFLVLDLIRDDAHSGRYLRERLVEEGAKTSAPAFYQLMARMEESLLISGWYESFVVDGQTIKERKYEITAKGQRTIDEVQEFYNSRIRAQQIESKEHGFRANS